VALLRGGNPTTHVRTGATPRSTTDSGTESRPSPGHLRADHHRGRRLPLVSVAADEHGGASTVWAIPKRVGADRARKRPA
jgi:hypothetical protein